jgi:hypothetical protein
LIDSLSNLYTDVTENNGLQLKMFVNELLAEGGKYGIKGKMLIKHEND